MKYSDKIASSGKVLCQLFDNDGMLLREEEGYNLIVNGGRDLILNQLIGGLTVNRPYTSKPVAYLALGSSATAVNAAQTGLLLEEPGPNGVRIAPGATSPATGQILLVAIWDETQNQNTTINEVGLFTNSASGGGDIMFSRYVLANPIPKDSNTSFQVSYLITITAT